MDSEFEGFKQLKMDRVKNHVRLGSAVKLKYVRCPCLHMFRKCRISVSCFLLLETVRDRVML